MSKILRSFALGSIALGAALSCAAAQAETLLVTWTEPTEGISVSWEQSSTAPPFGPSGYSLGGLVDVPVWNFTSTGATTIPSYTDIEWFNSAYFGLFATPDGLYGAFGDQAYSGDESAPVFLTGVYPGTDINTGADATVTISASPVPEVSTWAMMLFSFAGLGLAGYRASRRSAALAA